VSDPWLAAGIAVAAELDKALGQARAELARLRAEDDYDLVPALSPGNHALGAEHSRR